MSGEGSFPEELDGEGVSGGEERDAGAVGQAVHEGEAGGDLDDVVDGAVVEAGVAKRPVVGPGDVSGRPGEGDGERDDGVGGDRGDDLLDGVFGGEVGGVPGGGPEAADEGEAVGVEFTQVPRVGDRSIEAVVERGDGDGDALFGGPPER